MAEILEGNERFDGSDTAMLSRARRVLGACSSNVIRS